MTETKSAIAAVIKAARRARAQLAEELEGIAGSAATVAEFPLYSEEIGRFIEGRREQVESVILAVDGALALYDAAPDEGWQPDRPGWYWVKLRQIGWEPRQWVVHSDNIRFWDRDVREPEIHPVAVGPRIPTPPAPVEGGEG